MQNGFIESFNGKLRDECLNETLFTCLPHVRQVLANWRHDYNHVRPHSSLDGLSPVQALQNKNEKSLYGHGLELRSSGFVIDTLLSILGKRKKTTFQCKVLFCYNEEEHIYKIPFLLLSCKERNAEHIYHLLPHYL